LVCPVGKPGLVACPLILLTRGFGAVLQAGCPSWHQPAETLSFTFSAFTMTPEGE